MVSSPLYTHMPPTLSLAQLVPVAQRAAELVLQGCCPLRCVSKLRPCVVQGPQGQQSQPQLAGVGWAGRRPRAVLGIAPHPSAQQCGHMACTPPTGLLLYAALCSTYLPCFFLLMKNNYARQPGSKQRGKCWLVVAAAESLPSRPTTLGPSGAALGRDPARPDPAHRLGLRRLGPCPSPSLQVRHEPHGPLLSAESQPGCP